MACHPIETAPLDGTAIQAMIPGHGSDTIIAWQGGCVDNNGNDCSAWQFASAKEPPPCWTDGICWHVNEDGRQSVKPTRWKYPDA